MLRQKPGGILKTRIVTLCMALAGIVCGSCGAAPGQAPEASRSKPARTVHETEVIFLATPQEVVDRMLEVAEVSAADVVYDLGCGDGRVVVTAARKYGAHGLGVEIHPQRVAEARDHARKAGVEHLVRFEQGDIFEVDLKPATVVALYLFPDLNTRLLPQLQKLRPGARIVSHDFGFEGKAPERVWKVQAPVYDGAAEVRTHELLLWHAPIRP